MTSDRAICGSSTPSKSLGHPTVVALTATASPVVRREIVERLGLRDPLVIASGFDRPNIRLQVSHYVEDDDKRDAVVDSASIAQKPALLYAATRRDAETYGAQLLSSGMRAVAYHAGLNRAQRNDVHARFRAGELEVVVATSAFGMGIDKADVRTVLRRPCRTHWTITISRSAGRPRRETRCGTSVLPAGRPRPGPVLRLNTVDEELLAHVYSALRSAGKSMRLSDLRDEIDAHDRTLTNALNLFNEAGLVEPTPDGFQVSRRVAPDTAVAEALAIVERGERIDRTRVEMMRGYAETRDCRGNSCSATSVRRCRNPAGTATGAT